MQIVFHWKYDFNLLAICINDEVAFLLFEYLVSGYVNFMLMNKIVFSSPSTNKTTLNIKFDTAKNMPIVYATNGLNKTEGHTKYSLMY